MVRIFTPKQSEVLTQAVAKAEQNTSAELVVVTAPASDGYADFVLLMGFWLGAIFSLALWLAGIATSYAELVAIQASVLLILFYAAPLQRALIRFVPKKVRAGRSASRAAEEYFYVHRKLPVDAPMVLMFVSLAERQIHIISNYLVSEKLPDSEWESAVALFVREVKKGSVLTACEATIAQIGHRLQENFPDDGCQNQFSDEVIARP